MPKIRDLNSDYTTWSKNHKDWHNGIQIDLIIWDDVKQCHFSRSTCCSPNNQVYPLKRVPFENITVFIPQNSKSILKRFYGNIDIPPVNTRMHHQGKVSFEAPSWVKKKYPQLYHVNSNKDFTDICIVTAFKPPTRKKNYFHMMTIRKLSHLLHQIFGIMRSTMGTKFIYLMKIHLIHLENHHG